MIKSMPSALRALSMSAAMSVALLGSACLSSVLPKPAPADVVYRLSTASNAVEPAADAHIVRVDRPFLSKAMQGRDIIVSPNGRELAVAGGAKWAEPLPAMLQSAILDSMAIRPDLVAILPTSGARTEYRVHMTVRHFEAEFDQGEGRAPLAVVQYGVTLSNASNRNLIGTYDARQTQRASDYRVSDIVVAQDNANQAALSEINDWIAQTLRAHIARS